MKEAPKEVEVNFVINYYKDMDYADEIEYSNSFTCYADALKAYEEAIEKAKGEYFIELTLEIDKDKGSYWEQLSLANNYIG